MTEINIGGGFEGPPPEGGWGGSFGEPGAMHGTAGAGANVSGISALNQASVGASASITNLGASADRASAALDAFAARLSNFGGGAGGGGGGGIVGYGGGYGGGGGGGGGWNGDFYASDNSTNAYMDNSTNMWLNQTSNTRNNYIFKQYAPRPPRPTPNQYGVGAASSLSGFNGIASKYFQGASLGLSAGEDFVGMLTGAAPPLIKGLELAGTAVAASQFKPEIIGEFNSMYADQTAVYRNANNKMIQQARAMGLSDDAITKIYDPANYNSTYSNTRDMLRSVGLGPQDVPEITDRLGIVARSPMQQAKWAKDLESMKYIAGFAGSNFDQDFDLQKQMMGLGVGNYNSNTATVKIQAGSSTGVGTSTSYTNKDDPAKNNQALLNLFADATAKGMDKSLLATTLSNTLSILTQNGATQIDPMALSQAIVDSANTGTPGGRNGSALQGLMGGISANAANPFGNGNFNSYINMAQAALINNTSDLKKYGLNGVLSEINTPIGKKMWSDYQSAPAAGRALILQNLLAGDSDPIEAQGFTKGVLEKRGMSGFTENLALGSYYGTNYNNTVINSSTIDDSNSPALQELKAKYPGQYSSLLAAASKTGVPPSILAAIEKLESNFNPNTKFSTAQSVVGAGPSTAYGVMQIISDTWKGNSSIVGGENQYTASIADQQMVGGEIFRKDLIASHGDFQTALKMYNGGPGYMQKKYTKGNSPDDYVAKIESFMGNDTVKQFNTDLSQDQINYNAVTAGASEGAYNSAADLNGKYQIFANAVDQFSNAVSTLVSNEGQSSPQAYQQFRGRSMSAQMAKNLGYGPDVQVIDASNGGALTGGNN